VAVWLILVVVRPWRRFTKARVDAKVAAAVEEPLLKEKALN
jgi:hypothetical protein